MRPLPVLLLSLCLLGAGGCLGIRDKYESEPWTARQWHDALAENQLRLLKEDQRKRSVVPSVFRESAEALKDQIERIYNYITGNTPFNAAKELLEPARADSRREAIAYFADRPYGREKPYTDYFIEMARTDPNHTVRAMAIRALNRARVAEAVPHFIAALEDEQPLVRLEAAKALANIPDRSAIAALTRHLQPTYEVIVQNQRVEREETVDVRIACADALRNFPEPATAQALVRMLRDPSFSVAWQARRSLMLMTGQDHRYDPAAWLGYLSTAEKPFI
jgi:hypothetical protein